MKIQYIWLPFFFIQDWLPLEVEMSSILSGKCSCCNKI